ncbi:MAG: (Na+)-NQR maturation NqrM [Congregibacter sp.]|nr:(Na+)-NQR maturation NqrM [Congregibacter sp.]MDP5071212.1 (Na+)-NQR maturation NqrM [Congregibacter sp.]
MVFVLAFLIMALIMCGMAVGAMAGRGPLKGSCGGLAAVGIEGRCDICGDDPSLCKEQSTDSGGSSYGAAGQPSDTRFYDASK